MFVKSASIRYSSFLGAFYISSFYHFLAFISALIPKIINICHRICFVVAKECLCLLRLRQSFLMFRIKSRDPSQSRLRMTLLLSLRGHAFALYGRGNLILSKGWDNPLRYYPQKWKRTKVILSFWTEWRISHLETLGGVLRRVLSPPQINKAIAASGCALLAMTDRDARLPCSLRSLAMTDWVEAIALLHS